LLFGLPFLESLQLFKLLLAILILLFLDQLPGRGFRLGIGLAFSLLDLVLDLLLPIEEVDPEHAQQRLNKRQPFPGLGRRVIPDRFFFSVLLVPDQKRVLLVLVLCVLGDEFLLDLEFGFVAVGLGELLLP